MRRPSRACCGTRRPRPRRRTRGGPGRRAGRRPCGALGRTGLRAPGGIARTCRRRPSSRRSRGRCCGSEVCSWPGLWAHWVRPRHPPSWGSSHRRAGPTLGSVVSRTSVLDRVERLGDGGLTAKAYRERVLAEVRSVLPYDGHVWLLTDPVTRVGTSPLADVPGLAFADLPRLGRLRYLTTVNRWDRLLDEGRRAATLLATTGGEPDRSVLWRDCLSGFGVS